MGYWDSVRLQLLATSSLNCPKALRLLTGLGEKLLVGGVPNGEHLALLLALAKRYWLAQGGGEHPVTCQ